MNRHRHHTGGRVRGANMVEYIILVGLVALLCISGFTFFGESVKGRIIEEGATVSGIK